MFLSRLILDPRSRRVRRDIADCQQMHRTLMSAFTGHPALVEARGAVGNARAQVQMLYRLDVDTRTNRIVILVQSSVRPDWSRLEPGYLLVAAQVKDVTANYAAIEGGMILAFRLLANPTKKIDTKSGPDRKRRNGRRVELRREEDLVAWLRRKGEGAGFALEGVIGRSGVVDVRTSLSGSAGLVTGRRDGARLTFGSALFEGRLRVIDAQLFRRALAFGIGSGKAYGFGLLSVAPVARFAGRSLTA